MSCENDRQYAKLCSRKPYILKKLYLIIILMILGASLAAAPPKKSADSPVGMRGQEVEITQPDPKHPGHLEWHLWAKSLAGQSVGNEIQGQLVTVTARLYQKGVPAATLLAPLAKGDVKKITATGGVTIKSLQQPGTILRADNMVWLVTLDKIIATGHVYYHDGKSGLVMRAPQMVANTALKTINSAGAGEGILPKR